MTDFQPKTTAELEDYLEKMALAEGPLTFGLYKAMLRIGSIAPPDILEQVKIAQQRQRDSHLDQIKYAREEVLRVLSTAPLTAGDDERELAPLPIAGNPASGVEHPERGPDRTLAQLTNDYNKPIDGRTREGRAARATQRVG